MRPRRLHLHTELHAYRNAWKSHGGSPAESRGLLSLEEAHPERVFDLIFVFFAVFSTVFIHSFIFYFLVVEQEPFPSTETVPEIQTVKTNHSNNRLVIDMV